MENGSKEQKLRRGTMNIKINEDAEDILIQYFDEGIKSDNVAFKHECLIEIYKMISPEDYDALVDEINNELLDGDKL
jgi:hypothetical protein